MRLSFAALALLLLGSASAWSQQPGRNSYFAPEPPTPGNLQDNGFESDPAVYEVDRGNEYVADDSGALQTAHGMQDPEGIGAGVPTTPRDAYGLLLSACKETNPVMFLIPKALRPHVAVFYAYARAIDDIADNPALGSNDKVARLDAFANALHNGSRDPALAKAER